MEWVEKTVSWVEMTKHRESSKDWKFSFSRRRPQRFKNLEEEEARKENLGTGLPMPKLESSFRPFISPSIQKVLEQKAPFGHWLRIEIASKEEIIQNLSLDILSMKQRLDREVRKSISHGLLMTWNLLICLFSVSKKQGI